MPRAQFNTGTGDAGGPVSIRKPGVNCGEVDAGKFIVEFKGVVGADHGLSFCQKLAAQTSAAAISRNCGL